MRSKQRVGDHGEVFTPGWMVDAMLDLVRDESERIDSRFLEPACGSGNFVVPVLSRKLAVVEAKYGTSDFEKRHYAQFGLMCIYGIELLEDNARECRQNLLETFSGYLGVPATEDLCRAADNGPRRRAAGILTPFVIESPAGDVERGIGSWRD